MADNVELNPGTGGAIAATDEVAGAHFQRIKLDLGAEGESLPVSGAVPISAAALPLPAGAATDATLAALQTLLSTIAGTIQQHNAPFADGMAGQVMLGKRRDSDISIVADGDLNTFNMDAAGRLKVATQPGTIDGVTQNITANAQTIFINVERASNVTISLVASALVGHNATFEYSNNSTNGTDGNWYVIQVVRSNANTVETATGVLAATPVYGWEASVNASKWFRVRATAHTSGTAIYTLLPGSYATEPIPAVQITGTQGVSGTVTGNIGASGLAVYTDSATNLGASATFTGTARDGGATPGYNKFIVNAVANQAGTVRVEKSADNVTWRRATGDIAVAINVPQQLEVLVTTRYMRPVYVNGGVAQTEFLLTSAYHRI